jgi:hypothetical protein
MKTEVFRSLNELSTGFHQARALETIEYKGSKSEEKSGAMQLWKILCTIHITQEFRRARKATVPAP